MSHFESSVWELRTALNEYMALDRLTKRSASGKYGAKALFKHLAIRIRPVEVVDGVMTV
jgi:hypothetical protein